MSNNKYTTPLNGLYKSKIEGVIKIKHKDITFNVCRIAYETFDDGQYQYVFEPYYSILDALPSSFSQGIPGIDLSKRNKVYYRVNMTPSFISERTIDENREDLKEQLSKMGMDEYNPLEWLIRTNTEYSGDNLIVERYRIPQELKAINLTNLMYGDSFSSFEKFSTDLEEQSKQIIAMVGSGVNIETDELIVDDSNRTGILKMLIYLLRSYYNLKEKRKANEKQLTGVEVAKKKKRKIDDFLMEEVIKELELNIIDEKEAMNMLNINTRSTLYRKIREYKLDKLK